ncbi:2'-5' RNA ligase family protein [Actinokineospora sp. NBRC 105648]|uniref:2'-5' RNA ligase family protein n=1 Tax=Actinokineospora sp. NBRC 105648 TaxID=3032206 RepID=UPI0025550A9A|nr:2'-5' RNA ligase family protein [Actinokineospora sp. NBRC 105648]
MRDHWWWRPGWAVGRSFYTWHITFEGNAGASSLVRHYAPLLDNFRQLDQVGIAGLHLTVQGLGFADEVSIEDANLIAVASRHRLALLEPFSVRIGPAHIDPETVQMHVAPTEPLNEVRLVLREAIAEVWGHANVPEREEKFQPHVTLAYSNAEWSSESLASALAGFPPLSVTMSVDRVSLINLNRDRKRYEWVELSSVSIGR